MRNIRTIFSVVLAAASLCCRAQDDAVIKEYINTYGNLAIEEMERTGVPASIKLAQGIHETMAGTSELVKKSNNHFGIKCKADWAGESVTHTDDAPNECFRKYGSPVDSYRDHSDFLRNSSRYSFLFKLDPLDYKDWAYGLKKAGYATNPKYPQVIIKLIEDYNLQEYTLIALGKMPEKDNQVAMVSGNEETKNIIPAAENNKGPFLENIVVNGDTKQKTAPPPTAQTVAENPDVTVEDIPNYPQGEFKINETRVVYAKKGTSCLSIAQQYNVRLEWLFDFNEMPETETIEKDQLIYLQRKRKTGNNEYHIVKPGETLNDIARTEAIRIEALMEYNYLNKYMQPSAGEQLYLRTKAPAAPRLAKGP
jgi:Mannosyl-glycoprotein endo-beta-N-acetylglucosaminidase/LysM domain